MIPSVADDFLMRVLTSEIKLLILQSIDYKSLFFLTIYAAALYVYPSLSLSYSLISSFIATLSLSVSLSIYLFLSIIVTPLLL